MCYREKIKQIKQIKQIISVYSNCVYHQLIYEHGTCNANAAMMGHDGILVAIGHCHARVQYHANDNGIRQYG